MTGRAGGVGTVSPGNRAMPPESRGARLDPKTDGRPDSRPDVRESSPHLGDLAADFNFDQAPRAPMLLGPNPAPRPASTI